MSKPRNEIARIQVKLDTLRCVRTEMARVYRLCLRKRLDPEVMARLIYALKEIRQAIEAETLDQLNRRMLELMNHVGIPTRGVIQIEGQAEDMANGSAGNYPEVN